MARNFRQQGAVLTAVSPGGGLTSGDGYLTGVCFGVVATDAVEGQETELNVEGVWSLPKGAEAIAFGVALYWTGTAITATAGSNARVGFCARAADSDDATVDVRLCPAAVLAAGG